MLKESKEWLSWDNVSHYPNSAAAFKTQREEFVANVEHSVTFLSLKNWRMEYYYMYIAAHVAIMCVCER